MSHYEMQLTCPHCNKDLRVIGSIVHVEKGLANTERKKRIILDIIGKGKEHTITEKELSKKTKEKDIETSELNQILYLLKLEGDIFEIRKGELKILN